MKQLQYTTMHLILVFVFEKHWFSLTNFLCFQHLVKRLDLYFSRLLEVILEVWVYLWVCSWLLVDQYVCKGVSTCFSVSCGIFGKVIN